jgi:O-antigen/teichoic acid export membrane protein
MNAFGYTYLYKKNIGPIFKWKINKEHFLYLAIKSWPFTLSTIATAIYVRIDQIFLKLLLGSEAVGLYVVAVRFSEVWFFVSGIICASLLPAILNAQKTSSDLFLARSKKLYTLLFYTAILICIFIFMAAPLIINLLYGQEYATSIPLLRIYIWSITGVFISTALQQLLLAQNKFKTILYLNVLGMVISLLLNYIFITKWGVKGAAISNICAYTIPFFIILSSKSMKDQRKAFVSGVFKPFS